MANSFDENEIKAAGALVSAALHIWDYEVTLEEIEPFLLHEVSLSKEDEAALKQLGDNPFRTEFGTITEPNSVTHQSALALHRKRPTDGFCQSTEEEIKKKRDELLQRLRNKKSSS